MYIWWPGFLFREFASGFSLMNTVGLAYELTPFKERGLQEQGFKRIVQKKNSGPGFALDSGQMVNGT